MRSYLYIISCLLTCISLTAQDKSEKYVFFKMGELDPVMIETFRFNDSGDKETFLIERFPTIISETEIDTSRIVNLHEVPKQIQARIMKLLIDEKTRYGYEEVIECYIPRHVLLFYDHKGPIIGLIEICFICEALKTFGICDNLDFDMRREDYIALEEIFEEVYK